jgi:hypothetical protein
MGPVGLERAALLISAMSIQPECSHGGDVLIKLERYVEFQFFSIIRSAFGLPVTRVITIVIIVLFCVCGYVSCHLQFMNVLAFQSFISLQTMILMGVRW